MMPSFALWGLILFAASPFIILLGIVASTYVRKWVINRKLNPSTLSYIFFGVHQPHEIYPDLKYMRRGDCIELESRMKGETLDYTFYGVNDDKEIVLQKFATDKLVAMSLGEFMCDHNSNTRKVEKRKRQMDADNIKRSVNESYYWNRLTEVQNALESGSDPDSMFMDELDYDPDIEEFESNLNKEIEGKPKPPPNRKSHYI